jgi:hypothetical protein
LDSAEDRRDSSEVCPFDDEDMLMGNEDNVVDSSIEPEQLLASMFQSAGPSASGSTSGLGLADELDPGKVDVPELGRGKRSKTTARPYEDQYKSLK